jgi:hypothetical protein
MAGLSSQWLRDLLANSHRRSQPVLPSFSRYQASLKESPDRFHWIAHWLDSVLVLVRRDSATTGQFQKSAKALPPKLQVSTLESRSGQVLQRFAEPESTGQPGAAGRAEGLEQGVVVQSRIHTGQSVAAPANPTMFRPRRPQTPSTVCPEGRIQVGTLRHQFPRPGAQFPSQSPHRSSQTARA